MTDQQPEDAGLFESLHRAQWIAQREATTEYGRLLRNWMADRGDGIIRDWYLRQIDQATKVSSDNPNWELLRSVVPQQHGDKEIFSLVAGTDSHPLAIDEQGNWRIQAPHALELAKSYLSSPQQDNSHSEFWAIAVGVILLVGLLARCT